MQKMSHLRVVSDDVLGHYTRVIYVSKDGEETDISDIVQNVRLTVDLAVGDLNKVTIDAIKVVPDVRGMAEQLRRELIKINQRNGNVGMAL